MYRETKDWRNGPRKYCQHINRNMLKIKGNLREVWSRKRDIEKRGIKLDIETRSREKLYTITAGGSKPLKQRELLIQHG